MNKWLYFLAPALLILAFWPEKPVAQNDGPVVVELFTSQSCSSCPPADKLLHEIATRPDVIALGCHVTYWDHLHWKDTLSQEFCTERQRAYAAHKNTRRVYTPQMIVNGDEGFVGSKRRQAEQEIRKGGVKAIDLAMADNNSLTISLPKMKAGTYRIWVMRYKDKHVQAIPSGENRGRTLSYTNAVLSLETPGNWDGEEKTYDIRIPDRGDIDGVIVLAQVESYGPIIAAGKLPF